MSDKFEPFVSAEDCGVAISEWCCVTSAFINNGNYLCYCNDIVSSWCEVLTYRYGVWYKPDGNEFASIVTHLMPLPEPPKDE